LKKMWKVAGLVMVSAALLVAAPMSAQAGSHWSAHKCSAKAAKWIQTHAGYTPEQALNYEKKQHKKHGCPIGG
jgi:ABC-type glycerol-3-phosphate transport system substrate-binding protein